MYVLRKVSGERKRQLIFVEDDLCEEIKGDFHEKESA